MSPMSDAAENERGGRGSDCRHPGTILRCIAVQWGAGGFEMKRGVDGMS